jgi:HAMP domain-containing protein
VVAALGAALLVTRARADQAAEAASALALRATRSAIGDALVSRSRGLRQLAAALVQVPAYVSRIGEALRTGDRSNLLDQADELRAQTAADWVLITDRTGVLQAWTLDRAAADQDFSQGALIGRALEGRTTEGLWIEPTPRGDELYQAVGVPVIDPGGAHYGVVVAALRIDSALASQLERHTNSEILFFSRDSTGTPSLRVSTLQSAGLDAAVRGIRVEAAPGDTSPTRFRLAVGGDTYEGVTGLLHTADSVPIGGYVGLHSRETELAAWRQLTRAIRWAFAGGLLLALASSMVLARQITRPLGRLVAATRGVAEGSYDGVTVASHDEIGELATAFDRMIEELREKDRLVAYFQTRPGVTVEVTPAPVGSGGVVVPGMRFAGRYDIEEVLGRGGMGVVYRARDSQLGEPVAIKLLRPELGSLDPTLLERFKQELRLARRITHRNVVRTFDLGEAEGVYYITMEYVHGTTLATLIRQSGRLDVPATLTIGKQLCRALEVAHEEGIIHRDIKPQNLLVDPAGFLKVMDFGIARLAERATEAGDRLTGVGMVVGTPQYMAPEQLFGEPVDQRTDLYAAGAVLYECLTGRVVFYASGVAELAGIHLRSAAPDPRLINADIPPALSAIILRALERRPEERWASAAELLAALEQV